MQFNFKLQHDAMECGPACLQMIAKHYGKRYDLQKLRELCFGNRNGVTMLGISDAAESLGFRSIGVRIGIDKFIDKVIFPCIIHWRQSHFVIVYKIKTRCQNARLRVRFDKIFASFSSNGKGRASPA